MKNLVAYLIAVVVVVIFVMPSCKKLINIESPKNQLTTDKVFADTASATAAVLNIYDVLQNQQYNASNQYLSSYTDESLSSTASNLVWNQSVVPSNNSSNTANWGYLYSAIYQCNLIIQQGSGSELPASFINKIQSEAIFLRAYAYFYLINLYGRVPLLTTTDVNANRSSTQSDSSTVYKQIISDLLQARNNLPVAYPAIGKVRANRACATALLAKVYLYQKNWSLAESLSTELIGSGVYTPLDQTTNVFKSTGKESILQFSTPSGFTTETPNVTPSSATVTPSFYFTDAFYQSFESGDLRKVNWIGTNSVSVNGNIVKYNYPFKYKNRVANGSTIENLIVLRIAEQYLIRAESRANQGKFSGANSAEEDINIIRMRAALPALHFTDLPTSLAAIYNERRHEMFFEISDRFMDLKRTGRLQSIMSTNKITWIKTSGLLPIPAGEIIANSKLIQNDGY